MAFKAPGKKTPLKSKLAFTPYQTPTSPPPGFYDPALDSQERAAQRGYTDLEQDTEQGQERANSGLIQNSGRMNEDYNTSGIRQTQNYQASLKDLLTSRTRQTEDYQAGTQERGRQYGILGGRQTQTAANQGVTGGGALKAALAARSANQGREQGQADLGYNRAMQDSMGSEARLNMGAQRQWEDTTRGYNRGVEDLGTNYQYGQDDAATGLGRAGRELGFFQQDTGDQRFFQAKQSGWDPGSAKPSNEFSDANGPYRVIKRGNQRIRVRPNGTTF